MAHALCHCYPPGAGELQEVGAGMCERECGSVITALGQKGNYLSEKADPKYFESRS